MDYEHKRLQLRPMHTITYLGNVVHKLGHSKKWKVMFKYCKIVFDFVRFEITYAENISREWTSGEDDIGNMVWTWLSHSATRSRIWTSKKRGRCTSSRHLVPISLPAGGERARIPERTVCAVFPPHPTSATHMRLADIATPTIIHSQNKLFIGFNTLE